MSSADTPKTIELYGFAVMTEALAFGPITPGMLVEPADDRVRPDATAAGTAAPSFAVENGMTGGGIDDDYQEGDPVLIKTFAPGSRVYALAAAGADAIAKNAGTLAPAGDDEIAVARAVEALDNSGGATPARIRVVVIPAQRTAAV
ncbi:hypothetical protein [Rhodovulum sulfidophilum]|uniref:hypothetical protein n=1 Tax=Rhodovulum sulfidophilum TaxID=35806 RepID=UPI001F2A06DD|nr:hypothetical protein [Rhodovulum sulfidophilum]MCE8440037.1 hypothetical protein [Rhodovulum sulfidophilum]MCE8470368.1 hypothetical protein [Rhodovulum sulfidophilum]